MVGLHLTGLQRDGSRLFIRFLSRLAFHTLWPLAQLVMLCMLSLINTHPILEPRRAIMRNIPYTQKYWLSKTCDVTPYRAFKNIGGILIWWQSHVSVLRLLLRVICWRIFVLAIPNIDRQIAKLN